MGQNKNLRRVLCTILPTSSRKTSLSESEAGHLIQVLRMRNDDLVEALDGSGHACVARLQIRGETVDLLWQEDVLASAANEVLPIHLELAILKGDAMEWTIEKAVELGARSVAPLMTAHTIVQVDRKGPEAFRDRWQKIADQALKQCGRLQSIEIQLPAALTEHLQKTPQSPASPRWIGMETERGKAPPFLQALSRLTPPPSEHRIIIGPEGGWSSIELELLRVSGNPVSFGPLVLRAETAAIGAVSSLAQFLRM